MIATAILLLKSDTCRVPKTQRMNNKKDKIHHFVIQE